MEPVTALGVAAASAQFVEQSLKIVSLIGEIRDRVKKTPQYIEEHRQTLESFTLLVKRTMEVDSQGFDTPETKRILNECLAQVEALKKVLEHINFKAQDSLGRKTWQSIVGMKHEKELRGLFGALERNLPKLIGHGLLDV